MSIGIRLCLWIWLRRLWIFSLWARLRRVRIVVSARVINSWIEWLDSALGCRLCCLLRIYRIMLIFRSRFRLRRRVSLLGLGIMSLRGGWSKGHRLCSRSHVWGHCCDRSKPSWGIKPRKVESVAARGPQRLNTPQFGWHGKKWTVRVSWLRLIPVFFLL